MKGIKTQKQLDEWVDEQPGACGEFYGGSKQKIDFPGLCGKCAHLEAFKTRSGEVRGQCSRIFRARLRYWDSVEERNTFWPLNAATLSDLVGQDKQIAILHYDGSALYL